MRKQTYANTRGVMPKKVSCFFSFFMTFYYGHWQTFTKLKRLI